MSARVMMTISRPAAEGNASGTAHSCFTGLPDQREVARRCSLAFCLYMSLLAAWLDLTLTLTRPSVGAGVMPIAESCLRNKETAPRKMRPPLAGQGGSMKRAVHFNCRRSRVLQSSQGQDTVLRSVSKFPLYAHYDRDCWVPSLDCR